MKLLNYEHFPQYRESRPERIIQFGEGNFLRGFVDWMIHQLNKKGLFNGSIVAIQPTPHGKVVPKLNAQDGLYTMVLRGIQDQQVVDEAEVITSISRGINPYEQWNEVLRVAEQAEIKFAFSNTTEAGLVYMKEEFNPGCAPLSYPGKLTAFLYHRYQAFHGAKESGLSIFPCELVEDNGKLLKKIVLQIAHDWKLPSGFSEWLETNNRFCNTLVDRIVTGYPKDQIKDYQQLLGYDDQLLTVGEPYHLFAIDGDETLAAELPFEQAGLNVHWGDVRPFRELKVRLLNGAHTLMVPISFLAGKDTVQEVMEDNRLQKIVIQGMYQEIFPNVQLAVKEKKQFADSVIERFLNPFNKHFLLDISLNSVYKFKTRLIPSVLDYVQSEDRLPLALTFSLAALITFYRAERWDGNHLIGIRQGEPYFIRDQMETLQFFMDVWSKGESVDEIVGNILENKTLWGTDLTELKGMREAVVKKVMLIDQVGMYDAVQFVSEGKV